MGQKKSAQATCPACGRAAVVDDAGNVAFHTRSDGSFYCNPKVVPVSKEATNQPPRQKGKHPAKSVPRVTAATGRPLGTPPRSPVIPKGTKSVRRSDAPAWECERCGSSAKYTEALCLECIFAIHGVANFSSAEQSQSTRTTSTATASGWSASSSDQQKSTRSWILEHARDALIAGLGIRRDQETIRQLRSRVPNLVADFCAALTADQQKILRQALADQKFVGRGALTEFGQSVVSDISQQRQAQFRGITSGGLPGLRR